MPGTCSSHRLRVLINKVAPIILIALTLRYQIITAVVFVYTFLLYRVM